MIAAITSLSTEGRIEYFQSNIRKERLEEAIKKYGEALACLNNQTVGPINKGAVALKATDDRKLMQLGILFIQQTGDDLIKKYSPQGSAGIKDWGKEAMTLREDADAMNRSLKGFKTLQDWTTRSTEDCSYYVFKDEPWFNKEFYDNTIDGVSSFLTSKGYERKEPPAPGQVVVYIDGNIPKHFGKIDRIDGDTIIVHSKFGAHHVNEHPLEVVPFEYGSEAIFFNPPEKSNDHQKCD